MSIMVSQVRMVNVAISANAEGPGAKQDRSIY